MLALVIETCSISQKVTNLNHKGTCGLRSTKANLVQENLKIFSTQFNHVKNQRQD